MLGPLFIAGTDTGVGKTMVTALLALKLRRLGIDVGVMKPFASGCEKTSGGLVSEDVVFLKSATGIDDPLDLINPIRLEEPLAPLVAARRAGVDMSTWKPLIREAYAELSRRHEVVLVEGVGGLLVPVGEENRRVWNCLDLIEEWNLEVLLVARRRLGTINHTLLTLRTPLPEKSKFVGLVFCDAEKIEAGDVAAETSPDVIHELTKVPVWAHIPYLKNTNAADLEQAAALIK